MALSGTEKKVVVRTAQGDEEHLFSGDMTAIDACQHLNIPFSAVSLFTEEGNSSRRVVGADRSLLHLAPGSGERVVLQFDRNLNYGPMLRPNVLRSQEDTAHAATEYIFSAGSFGHISHAYMTVEQCRSFVEESVSDFIHGDGNFILQQPAIVVGTSGGGDSNALLTALSRVLTGSDTQLLPVMVLGAPEWDTATTRAHALCEELGLTLETVSSEEVNRLLGRPDSRPNWLSDFRRHFPEEDPDVINTFAIRLSLLSRAKKHGVTSAVTGLNLEDLLAESFLRLAQGRQPLPFPVRKIDGVELCYPVYRVPKKILDGCHPKLSAQNYTERSVGIMTGRAVPYYLAQSMNSVLPGVEFDLINGFSSLEHSEITFDSDLPFATLESIPDEARTRWMCYTEGIEP